MSECICGDAFVRGCIVHDIVAGLRTRVEDLEETLRTLRRLSSDAFVQDLCDAALDASESNGETR